jgi:hypothetical protein
MASQVWDDQLGPLIINYWATVKRIYDYTALKNVSNTAGNTVAVGVLAEQVAAYGYANAAHILTAAGIAGNTFVGAA